jgi:fucose 4-O-acetylase-like acetyltransferase
MLWIGNIFCGKKELRIKSLDSIKGIAILAVVWGHVVFESLGTQGAIHNVSYNIVSSFEMPVFFIVAGFLLYMTLPKKDYTSWVKKKAVYLLIPHYIIDACVYLIPLWIPALRLTVPSYTFPQWIIQSVFLNQGEWFLWTLFCVFVILGFVGSFNGDKFWMLLFMVIVVTLIFPMKLFPNLFGMKDIQWYLPFAVIGFIAAKYYEQIKRYWWILVVGAIAYFPLMFLTQWQGGWVYKPLSSLLTSYGLTRLIQAMCGFGLVACIGYLLRDTKAFKWLGQNSLGIYITNFLFIGLGIGSGIIHAFTGFIISLCISVLLIFVFSHIKRMNQWFPQGVKS